MKVTIIGAGNMDAASEPVQLQAAMTFLFVALVGLRFAGRTEA
jgi:hypothetical protein